MMGFRYDIDVKEMVMIKTFLTTRFKESHFSGYGGTCASDKYDKVFAANRVQLNFEEIL